MNDTNKVEQTLYVDIKNYGEQCRRLGNLEMIQLLLKKVHNSDMDLEKMEKILHDLQVDYINKESQYGGD